MADISVETSETANGWEADVSVTEGNTGHFTVNLEREYYKELTAGDYTPDKLIEASFEFLLDREPKESILSRFDLPVINRYFPEYERKIGEYLEK